jgi:HEAT repeat protein
MTKRSALLASCGFIGGLVAGSAACEKELQDCAYWTERLRQPTAAGEALGKIENLACAGSVDELGTLFDRGLERGRILQILRRIGDPEKAAPILRRALLSDDLGKAAAAMVTEWRLASARPELVQILEKPEHGALREQALKALLTFEDPHNLEALLVALVQDDPDLQGIEVNRKAAEKLGEIGSKASVPALLRAAFMHDQVGAKAYAAVRKALVRIDPEAVVRALTGLLGGKDQAFHDWARGYGLSDWEWMAVPESIQLAMDQLDSRLVPQLVAQITASNLDPQNPPPGVDAGNRERWFNAQVTRLMLIWLAVSHTGGDDKATVIDPLVAVLLDPNAQSFAHQRLRAASILANLGTKPAVDALFAAFEQLESVDAKGPAIKHLAEATGPEEVAAFDEIFKKNQSETLKEALAEERTVAYLAVARECKDTDCLVQRLRGQDKWQVLKAAVLLARGTADRDKVIAALLERFKETTAEHEDIRRWCAIALTRLGGASTGDKLLALAEGLTDPRDHGWRESLEAFGLALKRRP